MTATVLALETMSKDPGLVSVQIPKSLQARIKKVQARSPEPARSLSWRRFVAWLLDLAIKKDVAS